MFLLVAMTWRLRMRMFDRRRLLLWLWFIAACAGPFAFDFLQRTYTVAVPRYAAAALPAVYLLAAVGLACLPPPARFITLSLIIFAWSPNLVSIYQGISRGGEPLRDVARAVSSDGGPSELILAHSIPSGVLGIARYANGSAEFASWVGQLGERQVPDSIRALVADRTRIRFVRSTKSGNRRRRRIGCVRMPKFSVTSVWVRQLSSTSGRKTRNSSDIAGTA